MIGVPAGQILLLSDHPDELDAAVSAGWSVLGVARTGEPNSPRPPHRWIHSFAEVDLRGKKVKMGRPGMSQTQGDFKLPTGAAVGKPSSPIPPPPK